MGSEANLTPVMVILVSYSLLLSVLVVQCVFVIQRMKRRSREWMQKQSQTQATADRLAIQVDSLRAQVQQAQAQAERWQRFESSLPANLTHDFRTPVRLIIGFCEALLSPRHALPAAFHHDIEAIHRSALRLQQIIESLLGSLGAETIRAASSKPSAISTDTPSRQSLASPEPGARSNIVVLSEISGVIRLFEQHCERHAVIGVNSVEAIGNLAQQTIAVVVVTGEQFSQRIPEIAQLAGPGVPLLTCSLGSVGDYSRFQLFSDFLVKPITFEALNDTLERLGDPIHEVLIIEDNRDQMELLARLFGSLNPPVKVWKAYSGREGLALLNEQHIDAAIVDVVLPDMDGLTLAHFLRAEPRTTSIPLILVSGHSKTAVMSPPVFGKITIYRFDGFQVIELIRHIETLAAYFKPTKHSSLRPDTDGF